MRGSRAFRSVRLYSAGHCQFSGPLGSPHAGPRGCAQPASLTSRLYEPLSGRATVSRADEVLAIIEARHSTHEPERVTPDAERNY